MNSAHATLAIGLALATSGCWQAVTPRSPDAAACTATLEPLPAREPYPVVTLRGTACDAERVVVAHDGTEPTVANIGLDGTYCVDVFIATPGLLAFEVVASRAGTLSVLGAVTTVIDPGAPPVAGATTCGGFDPANCNAMGLCR